VSGGADFASTIHGTAIAMGGKAVLLRGPPGAGKSDLALRCLSLGRSELFPEQVYLVSDDRVIVTRERDDLIVSSPSRIWGNIEIRGIGIVPVPSHTSAQLGLVVDLVGGDQPIERLPDPVTVEFEGIVIPLLNVRPFEASAVVKVLMALQVIGGATGTVQDV